MCFATVFRRTDRPAYNGNVVVFDTGIVFSPDDGNKTSPVISYTTDRKIGRTFEFASPPAVISATCRPRDNTLRTSFAFHRRHRDQRLIERATLTTWNQIISIGATPQCPRRRYWFYNTRISSTRFVFEKVDLTEGVRFFGTYSLGPGFNTICVP